MFSEKRILEFQHSISTELSTEEFSKLSDHFFSKENLPKKEKKITEIFEKHSSKFSRENKALFLLPVCYEYEQENFKTFFQYETSIPIPTMKKYNFIYDCLNFICYEHNYIPAINTEEYIKKILYDFSLLKEKGTLMILLDVYFTRMFFQHLTKALGSEYKTKLFINFYFIDKYDFLFIITIQKMAEVFTPVDLMKTKILFTEFFSKISPYFICSKLIKDIEPFLLECFRKMQLYYTQCILNYSQLKKLHPGKALSLPIKINPLLDRIDYMIKVTDNSSNIDCSNKKTIAVVILYEMSQDLIFNENNPFDKMAQILNVGRLITLECAILNPMNWKEIAFELNDEVQMMKPEGFNENILINIWPENNHKYLLYQGDSYLIRDCEEKSGFYFRQLFYTQDNHLLNAIAAKVKIKLVSRNKIKNKEKEITVFPMETQDEFKNKGIFKCIDEINIPGFYEKVIICMAFYLDLGKIPKNNIKIISIGAGLGIMSFYLYRFYKGNCEIDNIEKNKWMHDIGKNYFGLKQYDIHENRINWFFEDAQICIDKMVKFSEHNNKFKNKKEFYDLVFNETNDINFMELCSPSKTFFTDKFLSNVKKLLNNNGLYVVNVQTRSYKILYEIYLQISKYFPSLYTIPSVNRLAYIFICFKETISEEQYGELFGRNKEAILKSGFFDNNLVEPFYKEIISKIRDINEEAELIESHSKKG